MLFFQGFSSLAQQNRIREIQEKLQLLEHRTKEAERVAELAESDAREKDKELIEALKQMRVYETVHSLFDKVERAVFDYIFNRLFFLFVCLFAVFPFTMS